MKHLKSFKESYINNLSKSRKWPSYKNGKYDYDDMYFTYKLKKDELGKYLNTWFQGTSDSMITLKEVDKETSNNLYHRKYNPISIKIMNSHKSKGTFDMKAQIHSIDDSSYGIWWISKTVDELKEIRLELMEWLNKHLDPINGEEFLDTCVNMGADEDQKDYN